MPATKTSRPVHLVGSVPLSDAEAVFRQVSQTVGPYVRRIPDGETGVRSNWIGWQLPLMMATPGFETVPPNPDEYVPFPRVKLREGVQPEQITLVAGA